MPAKTCILPMGHSFEHLFVALKSGPTSSQCARSESWTEADIPAEWRNDLFENYGEVADDFTVEESDAVELDRR